MSRVGVVVALLSLWTSPAEAGTPTTCVAVWQGPTESCSLRDALEAKGTGRTENSARREASQRLALALAKAAQATMLDAENSIAAAEVQQLTSCTELPATEPSYTCFPQPQLRQEGLCYADLPDDPCWEVDMLVVEGVGWQAQEQARVELCQQAQASIEEQAVTQAERLRCAARCLTSVRVRCH